MSSTVIELFAGAGGAALGLHRAGFQHLALVERDPDACATLSRNLPRNSDGLPTVLWSCFTQTVEDWVAHTGYLHPTLLWSSFPCQPWSQAGSRQGAEDERNGWPITMQAIRKTQPEWFIGENVVGLTRHKRGCLGWRGGPSCPGCYLETVILPELREQYPEVGVFILDAADYGVPQHRRRVFIWAGPRVLRPPQQTHSKQPMCIPTSPWSTSGEALGRTVIGGGRNPQSAALRHTRSYRDLTGEPCVTITAVMVGNRGPFTLEGGKRRCLSPEECALLQGFPSDYHFAGTSKRSRYRQIGNAVPPALAEAIARTLPENEHE